MELNEEVQPLVTVIIPLYNAEKYITETIESVINQTYQNWKMIIVDDCSIDNSINIIKKYQIKDNRIKLVESESNFGGPAKPRNIGIDNAKGEYIAFLDADDVWLPNKLEEQLKFMIKNDLNFSSTSGQYIDESSNHIRKLNKVKNYIRKFRRYDLIKLLKYKYIYTSSVIVKNNIIDHFSEEKNCISVEDYYLWLQLMASEYTKYGFLHKELLKYRIVNNSVSERSIKGKQEAKSLYYTLKFIIENSRYDLLKYLK